MTSPFFSRALVLLSVSALPFLGFLSADEKGKAVSPKEVVDLLADPEFEDFTHHFNPKKSMTDQREKVWRIEDGKLQVTGKAYGYIRTNQSYRDYHLVLEYKWGERTWKPRKDRTRDCGLLVHGHGPDGSLGNTWIASIEAQLIEGGSGDILVLQGQREDGSLIPTRLTCETTTDRDGETIWKKGAEAEVYPQDGRQNQRINWKNRDPDWADEKGFRGDEDVANPSGEWNRMEVICDGGDVRIHLNGELVNAGTNATPSEGYVCLQSEAAEMWIRRFELWPLGEFEPEKKGSEIGGEQ